LIIFRNIVLIIILTVITITDLQRQEIDNEPIVAGLVFGVLFSLCGFNDVGVMSSIAGFFLGGIFFFILSFWGMGGGDIKLMAMIGYFLGWQSTILVMYLAFVIGAVTGLGYMIIKKGKLKDFVPFGPSIALATVLVLFFKPFVAGVFPFMHLFQ
jgi:leader peptidase (prepilin peptidase)/N-methyltransferase